MKEAFKNVGSAVASGTVTCVGASAFLFGGKMLPFKKFAFILCTTIGLSFLISMLLFGAILHISGPMRGCGDVFYSCRDKNEDNEDMDFEL